VVAAAVVTANLLAGSLDPAHVGAADDAACRPTGVSHEAAAHRIEAAPARSSGPAHCGTCHWLRDFRPLGAPGGSPGPRLAPARPFTTPAGLLFASLAVPPLPARAPPR
jgi:hypothetical protein